jgi:hypothetical protein
MSYTTVTVTPGVGKGIAVDEISGSDYQRVKVSWGAEGTANDAAVATPFPVQPVVGAVAVSSSAPLPVIQSPLSTDLTEAAINAAASGNNTLIAAGGASNKIRIYKLFLVVNGGAVNLKFQDGAAGTDFFPVLPFSDKQAWVLDYDGRPWFTGSANTLFNMNLSAAIQVSGRIYYTVGV